MGVSVGRSERPIGGRRNPMLRAPFFNYSYTREARNVLSILPGEGRSYYVLENIEWLCRAIREHLPRGNYDMDSTYVRAIIYPDDDIEVTTRHQDIKMCARIVYRSKRDYWYLLYNG